MTRQQNLGRLMITDVTILRHERLHLLHEPQSRFGAAEEHQVGANPVERVPLHHGRGRWASQQHTFLHAPRLNVGLGLGAQAVVV